MPFYEILRSSPPFNIENCGLFSLLLISSLHTSLINNVVHLQLVAVVKATISLSMDFLNQTNRRCRPTHLFICQWCHFAADCVLQALNLSKEKKVKLEMTLAFVALHKVRLASCTQRGHQCSADVFLNESNDNALALRTLSEEGVKVMTFNPTTWQFFHAFVGMGLPSPHPDSFLSGKYRGEKCHNRMAEDTVMASELRVILTGTDCSVAQIRNERRYSLFLSADLSLPPSLSLSSSLNKRILSVLFLTGSQYILS